MLKYVSIYQRFRGLDRLSAREAADEFLFILT
jgi:hypothetical protein